MIQVRKFIIVPVTFRASLIQIYYLYGSESFYLLLNFEHGDSGLGIKMLFRLAKFASGLIQFISISVRPLAPIMY